MLLQSLLKRLNGGADTASTRVASLYRQSSPFVYEKFPILPELLLKLMRHQDRESSVALQAQRIFPALEVIERFGVPKQYEGEVWQALNLYRANPVWANREKAARTIGMIIEPKRIGQEMHNLVNVRAEMMPNEIHGSLMTLQVLLARVLPNYMNSMKGRL